MSAVAAARFNTRFLKRKPSPCFLENKTALRRKRGHFSLAGLRFPNSGGISTEKISRPLDKNRLSVRFELVVMTRVEALPDPRPLSRYPTTHRTASGNRPSPGANPQSRHVRCYDERRYRALSGSSEQRPDSSPRYRRRADRNLPWDSRAHSSRG